MPVSVEQCQRLLLCTGKVYYDLLEAREERGIEDVAIMRIEQLYPLSSDELFASLLGLPEGSRDRLGSGRTNQHGRVALHQVEIRRRIEPNDSPCRRVTRAESASPSTGSMATHKLEQAELIDDAFAGL